MATKRIVNVFWSNIQDRIFSPAELRKEAAAIGQDVIDISRSRTMAGYDRRGKTLSHTKRWQIAKRNMLKGKWKFPRGSKIDSKWRARKVGDFGRLTGQTFADMMVGKIMVKKTAHSVDMTAELKMRTGRSDKVIRGLRGNGFDIYGLAYPSTGIGRKERRQVLSRSKDRLKLNARAKGYALEDE